MPCLEKSFKLQVNVSHVGAGTILMQFDNQEIDRGRNEMFTLFWAVSHFEVYVNSGITVVVYTDIF